MTRTIARTADRPGGPDGDHWVGFAGKWYARLEDAIADGARVPPSATPERIAQLAAEQQARIAEERALAAAARAETKAAAAVEHERRVADKAKKAQHDEALAYVAGYAGTWGLPLDIRADRRWGTKYMKLSERQVEALLAGKARDAAREAQRAVQADVAREIAAADEYTAHVAGTAQRAPSAVTADGMYRTPDGAIYKVQLAVNGSGHLYAKRLDVDTRTFTYEPGAIRRLTPADRMTVEQAAEFGHLYGFCCVCARTLTDERSIAAGIGPICAGRLA